MNDSSGKKVSKCIQPNPYQKKTEYYLQKYMFIGNELTIEHAYDILSVYNKNNNTMQTLAALRIN